MSNLRSLSSVDKQVKASFIPNKPNTGVDTVVEPYAKEYIKNYDKVRQVNMTRTSLI